MSSSPDEQLRQTREIWDRAAGTFDDEPDHGLRDPAVRQAWTALMSSLLPPAPAAIIDIGCGTGSLSVVMAGLGHAVTGIDLSPKMIALARAKAAAGHNMAFQVMNGAEPSLPPAQFDAIVCRHLLWALPEPPRVLRRWAALLRPGGRLVLIEGRWDTGAGLGASQAGTRAGLGASQAGTRAGLGASQVLHVLPPTLSPDPMQDLSPQSQLWGRAVSDERYAIVARLQT